MSDWNPTPAQLRDGERPDLDAHARRNLEQIRRGVEDGILGPEDLSADQRESLGLAE